jgi:hypothetical protein
MEKRECKHLPKRRQELRCNLCAPGKLRKLACIDNHAGLEECKRINRTSMQRIAYCQGTVNISLNRNVKKRMEGSSDYMRGKHETLAVEQWLIGDNQYLLTRKCLAPLGIKSNLQCRSLETRERSHNGVRPRKRFKTVNLCTTH